MQLLSIRLDVPVMIVSAVGVLLMALNGVLSRLEGALLVTAAVLYMIALVRLSRRETAAMRREFADEYSREALHAGRGILRGSFTSPTRSSV